MTASYKLVYWPMIPGRGEFPRLVLEAAEAEYVDVARLPEDEGGGIAAVRAYYDGKAPGHPAYAAPVLLHGDVVLAQSALISAYVAEREGLAPSEPNARFNALQLQLTVADVTDEAHDTHHPVSSALYYEDQKAESKQAAEHFIAERLPRYLGYFERVLEHNDTGWLIGDALSYVDLAVFQLLEGLAYAFPNGFAKVSAATPGLLGVRDRVAAHPPVAAYLASPRRIPFNEHGIFRRYPELDVE